MTAIQIRSGTGPLVLGLPHTGTDIPLNSLARLNENGHAMADTDWHIHSLYDGLLDSVTTVRTSIHRYVIDVNRDPAGVSLYPGQNTTGLCPLTDFDGQSIYQDGQEPDAAEIEHRRATYHAPYHAALRSELDRIHALHGFAILYDCHSTSRSCLTARFLISTLAQIWVRLAHLRLKPQWLRSARALLATPISPMAASKGAGRHATTGTLQTVFTPSKWNSPNQLTWPKRRRGALILTALIACASPSKPS